MSQKSYTARLRQDYIRQVLKIDQNLPLKTHQLLFNFVINQITAINNCLIVKSNYVENFK